MVRLLSRPVPARIVAGLDPMVRLLSRPVPARIVAGLG